MTATKDETAHAETTDYSAHTFLVMWCSEGLECVIDITEHEKNQLWSALKGQEPKALPNLNALVLRARYNPQRNYEIYIVTASKGIDESDIRTMFESSPQYAADLIRERGKKLYSDRANFNKTVIV